VLAGLFYFVFFFIFDKIKSFTMKVRLRFILIMLIGLVSIFTYSCSEEKKLPTVDTSSIGDIKGNTATVGGFVIDEGSEPITSRGICWSKNSTPTIDSNIIRSNKIYGNGQFICYMKGLTGGTKYYVRAYATSSIGTAYGSEKNFTTETGAVTDIDGNVYNSVTIGMQEWMKENLRTTKYTDGTAIPNITADISWSSLAGVYCNLFNNIDNADIYGRLYNWYTVAPTNTKKICPIGWHVPTDAEWTTLTTFLGGESGAAIKLKEIGSVWRDPNNGTNETGFSALPGQGRRKDGTWIDYYTKDGYWWSATESGATSAWCRNIEGTYDNEYRNNVYRNNNEKAYGFSIRCVRD
jgi:uncharacterized protein (TIGR02145 family)